MPARWLAVPVMAVAALVGGTFVPRDGDEPPVGAIAHAAADGDGDCSATDPCSLARALGAGRPVVALAEGRYPRVIVDRRVTVRPEVGARPVLLAVHLRGPGARLDEVRVEGNVMIGPAATGAAIRRSVIRGSVSVQANGAYLGDNDIGQTLDKDPVQVTRSPSGVVIERNRIHDGARGPARGHVDCIQVTSGRDIAIRDNDLRQCSNAAVIVKPDMGDIRQVTIERNRLAACRPRTTTCEGAVALYVRRARHLIADVVIRANEVVGTSSFDVLPRLVVEQNVLQRFTRSPACPPGARHNVVRERHRASCPLADGNVYGTGP
jgi:hypothetical protein